MHSFLLQSLCLEIEQKQQASDVAELESWSQLSTKAREELATLQCTLGSMKDYQVVVNCVEGCRKGLSLEIYSTFMNPFLYKVSLVEVERWLDAVQEMLSNDASGLGKRENLQEELNNCQVRQTKKMKTRQVLKVYVIALQFTI